MADIKGREDFIFNETLSELPLEPKSEEEVKKMLFKDFDPDKMMDAYEEQLGVKVKSAPMPKIRFKHVMLNVSDDNLDAENDDARLLDQLMNDPELYQIVNRSQYWTPRGQLKIFVEYTENLDIKKVRDAQKEKEKTNE